jgi:DNA-directed RNA polymerase III subunit RPC1
MGTSLKTGICATCGLRLQDCIGHFGYIELPLPVYHPGFFKAIATACNQVCKSCARSLLPPADTADWTRRLRRSMAEGNHLQTLALQKKVVELCKKTSECPHCGNPNGLVKKVGPMRLVHDQYRSSRSAREAYLEGMRAGAEGDKALEASLHRANPVLTPVFVRDLFDRIPASELPLLGVSPAQTRLVLPAGDDPFGGASAARLRSTAISHPRDMIVDVLPAPPLCIRPSVMSGFAGSNEDDLTVKQSDILRISAEIRDSLERGTPVTQLLDRWDLLQGAVWQFITGENPAAAGAAPGRASADSQPIRAFYQRLKGKHGRFRGNLCGKRVDFSSRTVISPDPNLAVDEVAVPTLVAKIMTFPEVVNRFNRRWLQKLVRAGPEAHPGANFVTAASTGFKRSLAFGNRDQIARDLHDGDIVERHLHDGDFVLFNRQPSLHKLSIMCHRARVMPGRTFRFNVVVCNPYNADFDGDEMNMHLPQTQEARAEASQLMRVTYNLCTPRDGDLIIAANQDFLTGAFLITQKNVFFDRAEFMNMVCFAYDADTEIDLPPPAVLFPCELWTGKQVMSLLLHPNRSDRVLVNLETKERNYTGSGRWLCPRDGYVVIRRSQLLAGNLAKGTLGGSKNSIFYFVMRNFSAAEATARMSRLAKLTARFLQLRGFSIGISDVTPSAALTAKKQRLIDIGYQRVQEAIDSYQSGTLQPQPGCTAEETVEAVINGILSNIREDAGQTCLQELHWSNAPLIMAVCGSKGSTINIAQMVACVGQQTISGNRIPDGFIDRSFPHYPHHTKAPDAKGFVGNSFYTGMNTTEFVSHTIAGREGLVDTAVKTAETGYMQRRLMKAMEDLSVSYDYTVRASSTGNLVQFLYGDDALDASQIEDEGPVKFSSLLQHVQAVYRPERGATGLLPYEIREQGLAYLNADFFGHGPSAVERIAFEGFLTGLVKQAADARALFGLDRATEPSEIGEDFERSVAVDRLICVTSVHLRESARSCRLKYARARTEPGTAVGALGGQSIGEPATQMTLKTFHFAGVASMNITLGVPRIKEIINAVLNINTPIINAPLLNPFDLSAARIVKGNVERTTLGDIALFIKEVFAPHSCFVEVAIDGETLHALQLSLTLEDVRAAIIGHRKLKLGSDNVSIEHSPVSAKLGADVQAVSGSIVVRPATGARDRLFFELQRIKNELPAVLVSGIPTVSRAVINDAGPSDDGLHSKTYELIVEGTGLRRALIVPGLVGSKTRSNSVLEVAEVLGIEAARQTIISEIQYTMKSHGINPDPRHIMLLADSMTSFGAVFGITRHGIAKMKGGGVLTLASFERTTDHLYDAALRGVQGRGGLPVSADVASNTHITTRSSNDICGVSDRIIMGEPVPLGTGAFRLLKAAPLGQKGEARTFVPLSSNGLAGSLLAALPARPRAACEAPVTCPADLSFWFNSDDFLEEHGTNKAELARRQARKDLNRRGGRPGGRFGRGGRGGRGGHGGRFNGPRNQR